MNKSNENELDNLNTRTDSDESKSSVELGDYSQLLTEDNEPTVSENSETVGFENNEYSVNNDDIGFGTDDTPEERNVGSDGINDDVPSRINNNKRSRNKNVLIIIGLVFLIGVVFVLVKKPFVNENKNVVVSIDSTEEAKMVNVVKEITSYYEDGAQMTVLKPGVTDEKLPEIKKAVDATQAEAARKEFTRLYDQLKEDIAAQQTMNSTNYEKVSNSTGS